MTDRAGDGLPGAVCEILDDTLTDRGMRQWWNARNRYLADRRPAEIWGDDPNREAHRMVIAAAFAFAEGFYV